MSRSTSKGTFTYTNTYLFVGTLVYKAPLPKEAPTDRVVLLLVPRSQTYCIILVLGFRPLEL